MNTPNTPAATDSDLHARVAASRLALAKLPGARVEIANEALEVLLRLAATPAQAGDALSLLHELQVLQIELQMQIDEVRLTHPA